jgi:hypothetical protein
MANFDDRVVAAIGKASEAMEYVERARGHLYDFHQLMGHADLVFGEASEMLDASGLHDSSQRLETELVGRNVLDGRWTFQIVDEFNDLYYEPAIALVRGLEAAHLDGRRHVYERRMKEERRTHGKLAHEALPAAVHPAPTNAEREQGQLG